MIKNCTLTQRKNLGKDGKLHTNFYLVFDDGAQVCIKTAFKEQLRDYYELKFNAILVEVPEKEGK